MALPSRILYISPILVFIGLLSSSILAQEGETFPLWTEGYLDIHHINTGKGDAAFFILPDGTTLLVDSNGETFKVFILDDADERFNVKAIYGPYTCD